MLHNNVGSNGTAGHHQTFEYQPIFNGGEEISAFEKSRRLKRLQDKLFLPIVALSLVLLTFLAMWSKGLCGNSREEPMRHPLAMMAPPSSSSFSSQHLKSSSNSHKGEEEDESTVRFLTFGSFDAWGYKLKHPTQEAYPYLLGDHVHNAALHLGGPALSAVCTESMTGAGPYDVIVMDYFMNAHQGLSVLARRLRQRFPNAIMIFIRRWTPYHIEYVEHHEEDDGTITTTAVDAIGWKNRNGLGKFTSHLFRQALAQTNPEQWHFKDLSPQEHVIDVAVEAVGGVKVELPHPENWDAPLALTDYIDLFQSDTPRTLSTRGHSVLARKILEVVEQQRLTERRIESRNAVGTWGIGDSCHMWYTTGILDPSVKWSGGAKLRHFASQFGKKYALEFPAGRGGSLVVENRFDLPRMLYLTYMTVGQTKEPHYPRTQVMLGDKPGMTLEPSNVKEDRFTHVPRTVAVGLVPSGTTVVDIMPAPDSKSHFRLTGWSLLGSTEVPFEHSLELEPADDLGVVRLEDWES